jgi:hypothetical protein
VLVDARRPGWEWSTLNNELERLLGEIDASRPTDAVGDLARQIAAVALGSLDVRPPRVDGEALARLVLEYPSIAPWWPDPESGHADYGGTIMQWHAEVQRLIGRVLAADQPPPIAGDQMRISALKALVRLCLEFVAWTETGSGDLAALGAAGGS